MSAHVGQTFSLFFVVVVVKALERLKRREMFARLELRKRRKRKLEREREKTQTAALGCWPKITYFR